MGIRFRKRAKIAPGINLNFSKSGTSVTVGGKGGSINIGKNGVYGNAGIPGTGIYAREKISGNKKKIQGDQTSGLFDVSYDQIQKTSTKEAAIGLLSVLAIIILIIFLMLTYF
jgi:hypothetical protein